jgi:hypothetical protein
MLTAGVSEEGLRPMREGMAGYVEQGAMPGLIALAVGQPVGPGNEHGSMAGGAHAVEWGRIRYIPFTGSTSGSLPPSCWWLSPLGWQSPLGLRGAPRRPAPLLMPLRRPPHNLRHHRRRPSRPPALRLKPRRSPPPLRM